MVLSFSCNPRWTVVFSRKVLPLPICREPVVSGSCMCWGSPPKMAPSWTQLFSPMRVPSLMVARLTSWQRSPRSTSFSTIQKGPISTSSPSMALLSMMAVGWMFNVQPRRCFRCDVLLFLDYKNPHSASSERVSTCVQITIQTNVSISKKMHKLSI